MTTETFKFIGLPSTSHYVAIWNASGQVFDFDDNTFKSLSGATTPYVAATERTDMGGEFKSGYTASLNLALFNATGSVSRFVALWYTDTALEDLVSQALDFTVQFGELGERPVVCQFEAAMTSTAGDELRMLAWLEHGGKKVAIASGTCEIVFREQGAGMAEFTASAAAPEADGVFEIDQETPGLSDDRVYQITVTIVSGGVTFSTTHSRAVWG